ncbi:MAG: hypothetical protein WBF62_00925 [Bradyrhizobium sp.]
MLRVSCGFAPLLNDRLCLFDQRGMGSEILFRQGDDLTMRDLPDLAATLALYRQLGLSDGRLLR